ncbi:MAG: phosphatase PAP2 family protein, partial [Parvularculaceae bacterium]|nr:phosphatase PAP2 family protein [Parvularculaceae bacterium]
MINKQPTCTPAEEARLCGNGSYPSGHSAIGFGWGLVLAEIFPERAAALVARGRDFGDSRRICNVHWLSDVEEGRIAAAATFARLQSEKAFAADLDAARREAASAPASKDCP